VSWATPSPPLDPHCADTAASSAPTQYFAPKPGLGVRDGAAALLQDVAELILEE